MKKKIISLFLAAVMVFSTVPAVHAEDLNEEPEAPAETETEEKLGTEEALSGETQDEEMQETAVPEEPEALTEQAEEPLPEETPEVQDGIEDVPEEDETDLIELMSEPLSSHALVENSGMMELLAAKPTDPQSFSAEGVLKDSRFQKVYLIAENKTTRYYLEEVTDAEPDTPFELSDVIPDIPAGVYNLRIGAPDLLSDRPTLTVSPVFRKKLRVLPGPDASVIKTDDGTDTGEVKVKLTALEYIEGLEFSGSALSLRVPEAYIEAAAKKGVFIETDLPGDDYKLCYIPKEIDDEVIVAGETWISIPVTDAPDELEAWVEKDGVRYGSEENPVILNYIRAAAQIQCSIEPEDAYDERLKFKSGNKKVVTVDAAGNLRAVGKGSTVITVTSAGNQESTAELYVTVEPVTVRTFRFDRTRGAADNEQSAVISPEQNLTKYNCPRFTLTLNTDPVQGAGEIPVTFTVSGGNGLKIWTGTGDRNEWADYAASVTRKLPAESTEIHLMAAGGGHYTVTAEGLGKTAVCTIDIDGFTGTLAGWAAPVKNAVFYKAGKEVTGWVAWDRKTKQYITGSAALKPGGDGLACRDIYYIDPKTEDPLKDGVYKIGKKLFHFDYFGAMELIDHNEDGITEKGFSTGYNPLTDNYDEICISPDGSLLTGWQEVEAEDKVRYIDPSSGFAVKNMWVPVRSGKGETWVNDDGETLDDNDYALDNLAGSYRDGLRVIDGSGYVFSGGRKKGAKKTGWMYLRYDSAISDIVTGTANNSIVKVYADPALNGRVRTGRFTVSGKEYCGISISDEYPQCYILLPGQYAAEVYGVKGVRYLLPETGEEEDRVIIGPDGSVVKNMLAEVYVPECGETKIMYAGEDGIPVYGVWVNAGGKNLYFDLDGYLSTDETSTGYYVEKDGEKNAVTAKCDGRNKGCTYSAGGTELTNVLLYEMDYYGGYYASAVLDKNGKLAMNTMVKARPSLSEAGTETFLTDETGIVQRSSYERYGLAEHKGRKYAVKRNGAVCMKQGLTGIGDEDSYGFVYVGKNGAIAQDQFVTVTINGEKRQVYTDPDGDLVNDEMVIFKGKAYRMEPVDDTDLDTTFFVTAKPEKAGWTSDENPVYLNKDGTVRTGIVTRPDGTKQCMMIQNGWDLKLLACRETSDAPSVWKLGGKYYLFNDSGRMRTGWVEFDRVLIRDAVTNMILEDRQDQLMYFDPKTGAAAAGGWKTGPAPMTKTDSGSGYELPAYGKEDIGIEAFPGVSVKPVNVSGMNAKLYFSETGDLMRGRCISIGKKVYRFRADGTSSYNAGWTNSGMTSYAKKNGQLLTGRQKINGQYYHFDSNGEIDSDMLIRTGKKWYYYGESGVQATPVLSNSADDYGCLYGSTSGKDLTAVWAKDGSLSKIVYTGSGKPAAGEVINIGWYDPDEGITSLFMLDAGGLPKTGAVYDISAGDFSCAHLYGNDGRKIGDDFEGVNSLIKSGGKYYVMDGDCIETQNYITGVVIDDGLDQLNTADRKTANCFRAMAVNRDLELYTLVNPDGTVVSNKAVTVVIDDMTHLWHTNRLGIPMDLYTPVYKFGGKWYSALGSDSVRLSSPRSAVTAQIRTKKDGELIGFYDEETGKPLSGEYTAGDWDISLKKGKPQTGTHISPYGEPYFLDPQAGVYMW